MTAPPDDLLVVALEDVEPDDLLVVAIEPPDLDVATVAVIDEAPTGDDGSGMDFFSGDGPPGVVLGAGRGDLYLDHVTGALYKLA